MCNAASKRKFLEFFSRFSIRFLLFEPFTKKVYRQLFSHYDRFLGRSHALINEYLSGGKLRRRNKRFAPDSDRVCSGLFIRESNRSGTGESPDFDPSDSNSNPIILCKETEICPRKMTLYYYHAGLWEKTIFMPKTN